MKKKTLFHLLLKIFTSFAAIAFLAGCSTALLGDGNGGQIINKSYSDTFGVKAAPTTTDYQQALSKAIQFYDANKCGTGVSVNNTFASWRSNCHTGDTVPGGFHDAGDHVKYNLPGAYSFMVLAWSLYAYPNSFSTSDKTKLRDDILKRFSDYFMGCYNKTSKTFIYQFGLGTIDHDYWGAPELQTNARPIYTHTQTDGYADVGGYSAAGFALMSMIYQNVDATYAAQCLDYATNLYFDVKAHTNYKVDEPGFYGKNPGNQWDSIEIPDKLAMAASFLYYADPARKSTYYADLNTYTSGNNRGGTAKNTDDWTLCWNDGYPAANLLGWSIANAENDTVKKAYYNDAINTNFSVWKYTKAQTTEPSGNHLKYNDPQGWGNCRYASAFAMLAFLRQGQSSDTALKDLAKQQIDYIMGDNYYRFSYIVGFTNVGTNYSLHVHHRAANGWSYQLPPYNVDGTNRNLLVGGMVGGPALNGTYLDDRAAYQYTEVGLDYNASLVGALAGLIALYSGGGGGSSSTPVSSAASSTPISSVASSVPVSSVASSTPVSSAVSSTTSVAAGLTIQTFQSGATTGVNQINGRTKLVNNGTSSITLSGVTVRYYLKNQGVTTLSWACDYTTVGTGNVSGTFANVSPAQSGADQYCVLSFTSGAGSLAPGASAEVQWRVNKTDWSNWDCTINYSYNPSTSYVNWDKVTAYMSGTKVWGTEPGGSTSSAASSTASSAATSAPVSSSSVASSTPSSAPVSSAASSTPVSSAASSAVSSSGTSSSSGVTYTLVTAPFTFDGAGTYHWKMSSIPSYENNYGGATVIINGMNVSGLYYTTSQLPAPQGGFYYIDYTSANSWSHFEAK